MSLMKGIDEIAILNDFPPNVGVTEYSKTLYNNLLQNGVNAKFHQFGKSDMLLNATSDIVSYNATRFYTPWDLELNKLLKLNIKAFSKIKSDIIHLSNPSLLPVQNRSQTYIVTLHDLYYLHFKSNSRLMSRFYKMSYNYLPTAQNITVVSEFTKEIAMSELGLDEQFLHVVYPAIDLDTFRPNSEMFYDSKIKQDKIKILHVGYDSPNKNLKSLYYALQQLPKEYELIRVGKNTSYSLNLIKKLNLEDRVTFFPNIATKQALSEIYRSADLFIFPSLYEGFGIPVIEALASGLPTIVSSIKPLIEVVGNVGAIIEPTIEGIKNGILSTKDVKEDSNVISKSRNRAGHFSLNKQFKLISELYKKVVG